MVCKNTNEKVPYFNAFVFLENKTQIGKVDEIFGPTTEVVRLRFDFQKLAGQDLQSTPLGTAGMMPLNAPHPTSPHCYPRLHLPHSLRSCSP